MNTRATQKQNELFLYFIVFFFKCKENATSIF